MNTLTATLIGIALTIVVLAGIQEGPDGFGTNVQVKNGVVLDDGSPF